MTKSKPTAKEIILQLKVNVANLESQLAAVSGDGLETVMRLQDFAERTRQLRESLADSDNAYTQAQLYIDELESAKNVSEQKATELMVQNRRLVFNHLNELKVLAEQTRKQINTIKIVDGVLLLILGITTLVVL